jgi:hypothetical protein
MFILYIMDLITNFEKVLQNNKTEEIILDDLVGDILKITMQYIVILLIVLILIYNFYVAYYFKR